MFRQISSVASGLLHLQEVIGLSATSLLYRRAERASIRTLVLNVWVGPMREQGSHGVDVSTECAVQQRGASYTSIGSTSHPCAISISTTAVWPAPAAQCRGVQRAGPAGSHLAPLARSNLMTSSCPIMAARPSAVLPARFSWEIGARASEAGAHNPRAHVLRQVQAPTILFRQVTAGFAPPCSKAATTSQCPAPAASTRGNQP